MQRGPDKTWILGALAAATLLASAGTAAADKRIVLMPIEGARNDVIDDAIADAVEQQNRVVPASSYARVAKRLDAVKRTPENVALVASNLNADGLIEGTLSEKGGRYILRVRIRDADSGVTVKKLALELAKPTLSKKMKAQLADKLEAAIAELEGSGGEDDEWEDEDEAEDEDDAAEERAERKARSRADAKAKAKAKARADAKAKKAKARAREKARREREAEEEAEALLADEDDDEDRGRRGKRGRDRGRDRDDDRDDDRDADEDEDEDADADDDGTDELPPGFVMGTLDDADADDDGVFDDDADGEDRFLDDGDGDDARVSRRGTRRDPRRPMIDVALGFGATARTLTFTSRAEFPEAPQGYQGPVAPALHATAELYPLAGRKGIIGNLGFSLEAVRSVGLNTRTTAAEDVSLPTTQSSYGIGVRLRHQFGAKPSLPSVKVGVSYARSSFVVDRAGLPAGIVLDMPDTSYTILAPTLGVRVPVGGRAAVSLEGRLLLVTDAGAIQQTEEYGAATITGGEGDLSLDVMATRSILVRLSGRYTAIGYEFQGNGMQTTTRDGDPGTIDVGGALDKSIGGALTVGYLY